MKGKTRIDVVDEFAFPVPVTMICKVLGVPLEDVPRFHGWIEAALDGLDLGPEASDPERAAPRQRRFTRRWPSSSSSWPTCSTSTAKQPGPGMFSAMVNDDGPEGRLSQESARQQRDAPALRRA